MKTLTVNMSDIHSAMRFDSSYHLSEGTIYLKKLRDMPHIELKDITSNIFTAGRSKRTYTAKDFGFPYLSNSDVVKQNPFNDCKYNSKKYGYDRSSFLKEGMIVTGRVGAIGQTAYITSDFEEFQAMGSDNIIRIEPKDIKMSGYLYSFLASKYGHTLLWKLASGAVQPYVSEKLLNDMPIPMLPDIKQQRINNLIFEASDLRVNANKLLSSSVKILDELLKFENVSKKIGKASIQTLINNYQKRIDSSSYINSGYLHYLNLKSGELKFRTLKESRFEVTRPGIFKRVKVSKGNGLAYIKGSELNKLNPFVSCEYLSKTKTPFLNELKLSEDQILFTCAGTVGDIKIISKEFEEKNAIGSQDIIRINGESSKISIFYLFAYLMTSFANSFIQSLKYGSVIERVEPFHIESVPILIPSLEIMNHISNKVNKYKTLLYEAFKLEEKAINLIEKEIESWQK